MPAPDTGPNWRRRDTNTIKNRWGKRHTRRTGAAKSAAYRGENMSASVAEPTAGVGTIQGRVSGNPYAKLTTGGRAAGGSDAGSIDLHPLGANTTADMTVPTPGCGSLAGVPVGSQPSDFAEALTMLARLPLTDAERANAVRRLMASERQFVWALGERRVEHEKSGPSIGGMFPTRIDCQRHASRGRSIHATSRSPRDQGRFVRR